MLAHNKIDTFGLVQKHFSGESIWNFMIGLTLRTKRKTKHTHRGRESGRETAARTLQCTQCNGINVWPWLQHQLSILYMCLSSFCKNTFDIEKKSTCSHYIWPPSLALGSHVYMFAFYCFPFGRSFGFVFPLAICLRVILFSFMGFSLSLSLSIPNNRTHNRWPPNGILWATVRHTQKKIVYK